MKHLIILTLIFVHVLSAFGQEGYHKHSCPSQGVVLLTIDAEYGDLVFQAWDREEISIEGEVKINGQANSQVFNIEQNVKKGNLYVSIEAEITDDMRIYTINKKDGTTIYKKGKDLVIQECDPKDIESQYYGVEVDATFVIKLPRDLALNVSSTYGDIVVNDYFKDLEVENTYGSVDAKFTELPAAAKISLNSTYSHVDVSILQSTNAELRLKTEYGQVFTDLDFESDFSSKSRSSNFGQDISAVLNNGNGLIELKANYSNIYLREISLD